MLPSFQSTPLSLPRPLTAELSSLHSLLSQLDSVATLASKKDLDMVLATPCTTDPPTLIGDPFRFVRAVHLRPSFEECRLTLLFPLSQNQADSNELVVQRYQVYPRRFVCLLVHPARNLVADATRPRGRNRRSLEDRES